MLMDNKQKLHVLKDPGTVLQKLKPLQCTRIISILLKNVND